MSAPARLATCAQCKRPYEYVVCDTLCPSCRAAEQAIEDSWTECARCGGELPPRGQDETGRKYFSRSHLCPDCPYDDLVKDIRKWGSG